MAQLNMAFDSSQHEDMNSFEPIPAGPYVSQITKSSIKDTKDKTGKYIEFEFTVLKGEFKGRKIWTRLNIVNKSSVAVEIAQKELATLCRACGKVVIQDTQQLHGIPFVLKLRIKPAKGDYPAANVPTGYEAVEGSAQTSGSADPFGDEDEKGTDAGQEALGEDAPWGDDGGEEDAAAAMNGDPDGSELPDDDIPF